MPGNTRMSLFTIAMFASAMALLAFTHLTTATASWESAPLHINLKEDDILHPETKGDPGAAAESRHVEADYDESPVPIIGSDRKNKRWVEVGNWTSHAFSRACNFTMGRRAIFNIWYSIRDEGYGASPEFRFTLGAGGTELVSAAEPEDDDHGETIVEYTASGDFEPVDIGPGTEFSLKIEYKAWEDCDVYFDNLSHDSGFVAESDFLHLYDMTTSGGNVTLELHDAFGTNWEEGKNFLVLRVDGNLTAARTITTREGGKHDMNGTTVTGTIVNWDLGEDFAGGEDVCVWVKFTPAEVSENRGMEKNLTVSIPSDGDDGSDGLLSGLEFAAAPGAIVFAAVYRRTGTGKGGTKKEEGK